MDVPEGNGNPLGNGLGRARQTRPIGLGDAPNRHQQRQGIVPPPVQNHNFEIKLGMINLVQNKMFHGLPSEDPIDHLDEFDRLCDLTKINGVSEDAIKLRLFPMSLADKAHQWEKSLPHGTITTWDECKKAFLAKFFSTGRTAKLRGEISSFIQRNNETFERLGRGSNYTSQCPHHGFNNESHYSPLFIEDACLEYDRTNRSSTHHSIESDEKLRKDVKALNEKLDKLILAQSTMKKVNFVSAEEMEPVQEGEDTQFAEVCYMSNGQGGPSLSSTTSSSIESSHNMGMVQKNNYQGPQDDDIVATEAPTVAFHTSPVELTDQARSAARSTRTLARSSQTSSDLKLILLDPYQPVDTSSDRLLSQSHKEVIHKFRKDLSEIGVELLSMESMSEAFEQMKLIQDVLAHKEKVYELSTHQINLLTSPTFLPKVKDQGKFTLPCTLGHIELDNGRKDWHCWSIAVP
ncbi:unnamed protein product [Microthlaspi erraticum]|uniref:Retrotransposon gag domain-containing protein n=1 Tax=Microthlaspi erraticum TaxID=1685480 RepID=A0A6D2JTL6_9BRAS|nr:unnamed protein product [Microthlaspi erraticum]